MPSATTTLVWTVYTAPSPIGDLLLTSDGAALTGLYFSPHKHHHVMWDKCRAEGERADDTPVLRLVSGQLDEYFNGSRTSFDVPLAAAGSGFQHRVWDQLLQIPYGVTWSYGQIAANLDLPPGGSRAVGLANGSNPISIIVPCHRVIGADGSLTGYGGGLDRKRFLLDLETPGSTLF